MRNAKVLFASFAALSLAFSAAAQTETKPDVKPAPQPGAPRNVDRPPRDAGGGGGGGGQRQQLSPEKAKAAWEIEAKGVSKRAGLSDDQAKAVVAAYVAARNSHSAASDKLRQEMQEKAKKDGDDNGGPGGARMQESMKAMEELSKSEREKLTKALHNSISPDQTTKVVASLGTFNRQWDGMADGIAGFGLDAAKQQDALNAVEDFVVASTKARAGAGNDPEAMRSAMQETRTKLTESMKKVLNEEQMKKFESTIGGGRGQGGRGQGGGRPGGGNGGGGGGGN